MRSLNLASRLRNWVATGVIAVSALAAGAAQATPAIQLDIVGGTYDTTSESVVIATNSFTLGTILTPQSNAPALSDIMHLSAAILTSGGLGVAAPPPIGSISINGTVYNPAAFIYGTPSISAHGIFPTSYIQVDFSFTGAQKITEYNVETNPGGWTLNASGTSYVKPFNIVLTGFNNYFVHFDLYSDTTHQSGKSANFAPFSHDASGGGYCIPGTPGCGRDSPPINEVPEPASLALVGFGLLGLGMVTRRRRVL